jgi:hypothetical protein
MQTVRIVKTHSRFNKHSSSYKNEERSYSFQEARPNRSRCIVQRCPTQPGAWPAVNSIWLSMPRILFTRLCQTSTCPRTLRSTHPSHLVDHFPRPALRSRIEASENNEHVALNAVWTPWPQKSNGVDKWPEGPFVDGKDRGLTRRPESVRLESLDGHGQSSLARPSAASLGGPGCFLGIRGEGWSLTRSRHPK